MLIKPTEEEIAVQKLLIEQGRSAMLNIKQATLFEALLLLRHRLVGREQDVWLMGFALTHGVPLLRIKDFQFTKDGEVFVGDDHEPTAPVSDDEAG